MPLVAHSESKFTFQTMFLKINNMTLLVAAPGGNRTGRGSFINQQMKGDHLSNLGHG